MFPHTITGIHWLRYRSQLGKGEFPDEFVVLAARVSCPWSLVSSGRHEQQAKAAKEDPQI